MNAGDILDAREDRVQLQGELQKVYMKPLLTHRVNMPGKEKNTALARAIFDGLEAALKARLGDKVLTEKMLSSAEGPVMIRVMDEDPEVLKAAVVALENEHPLGRFVDLDVYDLRGMSLSRTAAGHEPRRCYLCDQPAQVCVRTQRHSPEELLAVMERAVAAVIKT